MTAARGAFAHAPYPLTFDFRSTSVRIVVIDEQPWFVGKDVADVLGYADSKSAIKQHCKGAVKHHPLPTAGGLQRIRILSEADMLRLIVSSKLPAAEVFERWVFEEVLPSIRKTGRYEHPSPTSFEATADRVRRMAGVDSTVSSEQSGLFQAPQFREAQRFVANYLERMRSDSAACDAPEWNAAEFDRIVDGILARELVCGSWLLSISLDGLLNLRRIPSDARVVSPTDADTMAALISNQVPDDLRPGLLHLGLDRLARASSSPKTNPSPT
ncbi:BRO-N domain-containing protein [Burkholderia ambifaria]|uniref:BRO-N domain-containing protein n=1 Tax=Burkholderia ambifaria TaxID=152480 RepID=UPI00158BA31F|nr:Bro-N domain-containing protein [Burkholderia ambifaria]